MGIPYIVYLGTLVNLTDFGIIIPVKILDDLGTTVNTYLKEHVS